MVYHNTPLSNTLWSPVQNLASRSARSDLPISNTARKQLRIDCENLRTKYKNEHLPSHDLYIDQAVMYQRLKKQKVVSNYYNKTVQIAQKLYNHNQRGCTVQETQAHLKPYQPQDKKVEDKHLSQNNHMWTVKTTLNSKYHKIGNVAQSRSKRDIKPPIIQDF